MTYLMASIKESESEHFDMGAIKEVTGGDTFYARPLYKEPVFPEYNTEVILSLIKSQEHILIPLPEYSSEDDYSGSEDEWWSEKEMKKWKKVETFKQLKKATLAFLDGKAGCPYNFPRQNRGDSPLEPDTIDQLKEIKKINKLGFVTVNSQDGVEDQRAFLMGLVTSDGLKMIDDGLKSTELIYWVCDASIAPSMGVFPPKVGCSLTRRNGKLHGGDVSLVNHEYDNFIRECPKIEPLLSKLFYISIVDPIWERKGYLVEKVLSVLKS